MVINRSKGLRLDTRTDMVGGMRMLTRFCEVSGNDRPPFVLVHGLSMSSRYLEPVGQELARDYRVYAPDLPGYGESQKPPQPLDIEGLTGALRGWLDAHNTGPAYFLGNSLGCQVIVTLAAQEPQRVLRAVLVGPTMDPSAVRLSKIALRAVWNMMYEPLSFYPVLAQDYLKAGVRETFLALHYAQHDPVQEKLRLVPMPVLVVRGKHDRLVTQPWAEKVAALLPDGKLVVIPGGAHVVNFDQPSRLASAVKLFLEEE